MQKITNITTTDQKLLRKTVLKIRPTSINYEDSWGYIIQSTRYGGFKWYDPSSGYLIFFSRKSENDPTLVVPSFFADPEYLSYVIHSVQKTLKTSQAILKNINPEDVKKFLPLGFRPYKENENWCPEARFDDQTYPQLIIDLKKLKVAKGTIYENLRAALNKKPNASIRKYHKKDKNEVLNLIELIDKNHKKIKKGAYYESHKMYPESGIDKSVIINNKTGEIIGFIGTSDISSTATALVASPTKPNIKNTNIWGIYYVMLAKYQKGFKLATLGGCEFKTTYKFKKEKFRPIKELEKTHLVYDP